MNEENAPKTLDEKIANAAQACQVMCAINHRFLKRGLPMLVLSDTHITPDDNNGRALCINEEEFAFLGTLSLREATRLAELTIKIRLRGNYPYPPIYVILSGSARKGMGWVKLMEELTGMKLKSQPYTPLYSGKHYDGKGLFIIASDLPVAELKRCFPKLYSDVILLENTPSGV